MRKFYTGDKSRFAILLLLTILTAFYSPSFAQTYVNGNIGTGATSLNGTAAPAGTMWHELQNVAGNTTESNGTLGVSHYTSGTANFTVADNFVVPAGQTWTLNKLRVYAVDQVTAGTTSPYNNIRVRIYNGIPGAGGTIVYGDLTTNRFVSTAYTNLRAIFNSNVPSPGTPSPNLPIFSIDAALNTTLTAGTYWVEWQVVTTAASFSLTSQTVGVRTMPGYDARQSAAGAWTNLIDDGSPTTAPDVAIDLPFTLTYTTGTCAGTPAPGNTISSMASVCPGVAFSLSAQNATAGSGVTYQWQSATAVGGPYTNITGATNASLTTTLSASTFYQLVVTCGGVNGTSTPVQVTLNPVTSCYCTPTSTDCTDGDIITNVTLGTLNNNSTCGTNGYTDYTTDATVTVPDVVKGASNPITITAGTGAFTESVGVWIDYNQNGVFETSEFTLIGTASNPTVRNGSIAVPATALSGITRMRVRVRFSTALTGTAACTAYTYGETEDYKVNIISCVVSTVTTQPPATKSISCSGTSTITATIAGSLNQYQWQVLPTGTGAVWTDLANNATYSGVNTNTLTITNALPTLSGNQYRIRYSGGCTSPSVTTATTLTVTALAPTVTNTLPINRCTTAAPTAISIATPVGLASLSTTASGTLHTNIPDNNNQTTGQNDRFISNVINVSNIPTGATITGFNVKLNITHAWVGDLVIVLKAPNGKIINLDYALTGTGGPGASTGFTNTIISSTGTAFLNTGANPYTGTFRLDNAGPSTPGFTPTGPLGFDPNTTVLSDMYQGNGAWTLALYDYYTDNTTTNFLENWEMNISYLGPPTAVFSPTTGLFTDAAGTVAYTGQTLTTVYANPTANTTYTATVNTALCGAGTVSVPVNVGSPISGTSTVANISTCVGSSVVFSSTAPTGGINATYQWQVSTDAGTTWTNITGATSATYTISSATAAMSGNRYRVIRTVAVCTSTLTSTAGTLTVNPIPVVTVAASPLNSIYVGQTTTLTTSVSPNAAATYVWLRNGDVVPGATAATLPVNVDQLGSYTVRVTDVNGCVSTSAARVITAAANDILFIYPSPNSGQFQVRFYSTAASSGPRTVNIYDSKGSRVYTKAYAIVAPYTRQDVDLTHFGKGIYSVEVVDGKGKRVKSGRVIVL